MVKLKVCGMREERNIREVADVGLDYLGFIFYPQSPRYVGDAFEMPVLPSPVKRVGVFVNESTEKMLEKMNFYMLDYLQLHGDETPEQCENLKHRGARVIKAFAVDENFHFRDTHAYNHCVDYFLFDTKGKHYGGNARVFDWSMLLKYNQRVPFFLSGGIGPDNLERLANKPFGNLNLHAVDINSAVEVSPGQKNVAKIIQTKEILTSLNS
jgi:phosphoribosylanthranilate isomerase